MSVCFTCGLILISDNDWHVITVSDRVLTESFVIPVNFMRIFIIIIIIIIVISSGSGGSSSSSSSNRSRSGSSSGSSSSRSRSGW